MPSAADNQASDVYGSIMEEIAVRINSVDRLITNPRWMRPVFVREYGYLQLRICCELVALACLVCHNDIKGAQTKAITKSYEPRLILSQLESLHADFFPVPVTLTKTETGWHLGDFEKPYLKKDEIIALWSKSGDFLHKGSLRKLYKSTDNYKSDANIDDVIDYMQRLINLVNAHRTTRIGRMVHFVTMINSTGWGEATTTIEVSVAIAEAQQPWS